MKLISIELFGEYKGLRDQAFDFSSTREDVAVLIGANGSGKSQLMELIAEVFAYLERKQRADFRVRDRLGYDFRVIYQLASSTLERPRRFVIDSRNGMQIEIHRAAHAVSGVDVNTWEVLTAGAALGDVLLPRVIGYASGLSENLQRPFMKNALQFFDVIRVRSNLKKELSQANVDEPTTIAINERYLARHPGIFSREEDMGYAELFRLREADTVVPRSLFLDYDSASLLIMTLGMFSTADRDHIWREIQFRHPTKAFIHFDLRGHAAALDNARDIQRLIELAGQDRLTPLSGRTTEAEYEQLQLNCLAGDIELDFTDPQFAERFQASFRDPEQWFLALYKLQLIGVGEWSGNTKMSLRNDSFQGHVKKPLKGKLPLSVKELWMSDGQRSASLDDLSDGELQLLLTLGAVRLLGNDETLFLYDEPETHLNPSWRTRFHLDFQKANRASGAAQAFVSTHSPFLVSSLRREAVFRFGKVDGATTMSSPNGETFGASFDVLIKKHFDLSATISDTAIQEIRSKLADQTISDREKFDWLSESLGDSMERSFLINKFRPD